MSIRVLDENTISKIAAGEVIENPASVVKELVENAIDANAKNIKVEIKSGGTKLIKVSDDGDGFEKDDIKLAFIQHATSKLSDISDLDSISSFGFRGEALSSIAVVSSVSLISKRKADNNVFGYRCDIDTNTRDNYANLQIEEAPANNGTVIEVRDLFENIPVRKKFLKGIPKESALVEDIIIKFAIVRPDIAFTLVIDDKMRFNSSGDNNLKNVLAALYGREIIDNLVDIDDKIDGVSIKGYIAKPIIARNTRNDEIYFVNERYIKSKIISKAIENAYEEYLMQHKYPLVVLKISVDGNKVDVNVHPKKLEVRFSSDEYIYYALYNAIHNKLNSVNLIHEEKLIYDYQDDNQGVNDNLDELTSNNNGSLIVDSVQKNDIEIEYNNKTNDIKIESLPSLSDELQTKYKSGFNLSNLYDKLGDNKLYQKEKYEEKSFIKSTLSDDHRYIGQIFKTYILVEYDDKLYIIDQHAAHEKINYEKLMDSFKKGDVLSQKIFPSIVLKLTPIQFESVVDNLDSFRKVGFEIEAFGDNDIKVDAVPYNIINIGNQKLLMDMIDSFADSKNKEHYDSVAEKIASVACKKSIKANYVLSEEEVKELLRELFKLENPYNCPHGRPTIISLSKQEFEKKFGRIV